MRTIIPALLILIGFVSCESIDKEDSSSIAFVSRPVQSESLLVTPRLTFEGTNEQLKLNLKLKNLLEETVKLMLVTIQNDNGLPTYDEGLRDRMVEIAGGGDTTLTLTFNPINDKALYMATGLRGLMDSVYTTQVYYTVEGKQGTRIVHLESRMPKNIFLAYRESHDLKVKRYVLNTQNGFDEQQRRHLQSNTSLDTPPFVHTTEQELALAGLNFRIKCFHLKDSLRTELFVVNHSDMTIRIDTTALDVMMVEGENEIISPTHISNQKVTGSQSEPNILRKGDRTLISMRKYVRDSPEKLKLAIKKSFLMSTGKFLLGDDIELIPERNNIYQ